MESCLIFEPAEQKIPSLLKIPGSCLRNDDNNRLSGGRWLTGGVTPGPTTATFFTAKDPEKDGIKRDRHQSQPNGSDAPSIPRDDTPVEH